MANLATRRATFDSAIATLRQLMVDTKADIVAVDSDKDEIRRLRDRVNHGLLAMGLPTKGAEL